MNTKTILFYQVMLVSYITFISFTVIMQSMHLRNTKSFTHKKNSLASGSRQSLVGLIKGALDQNHMLGIKKFDVTYKTSNFLQS